VKKRNPPYAIIIAAVIGIVAVVALYKWKTTQDANAKNDQDKLAALQGQIDALIAKPPPPAPVAPTNMRNVLYATQPVEGGQRISPAFYESKMTPVDILPDAFTDQSDIVDFFAVHRIEKGDPLTPGNISKSPPFMSHNIPIGMRALALPIFNAQANSTGGFVVDGDKVDLLYTTLQGQARLQTQLIMQNLQVLYVPGPTYHTPKTEANPPAPSPGDPISITFLVTPEQAQALVFLTGSPAGQFNMILRARRDTTEPKIKPFDGETYAEDLGKIQRMVNKSDTRVAELAKAVEQEEKIQGSTGNTNETPTPTPPSP
jgi:Flp pilus assembly protein CpaB